MSAATIGCPRESDDPRACRARRVHRARNASRAAALPLAFAALLVVGGRASCEPGEAGDLSVFGSVESSLSLWEDRGSAIIPAGLAPARSGAAALDLRAEAGELSRCAFEGSVVADAASGEVAFELRELWAEWRPFAALSLRAGRQRLGFGSGFGWNPSNDLEPAKLATNPAAPRAGADAAQLRLEAADLSGFPLSLALVGMLPEPAEPDLSAGKAGIQLYVLAGGLELMLAGSLSDPGGAEESWLAGAWATFPLGRLVIGLEGAARKRADFYRPDAGGTPVQDRGVSGAAVCTATLRAGDFLAVAEAYWNGAAYTRGELDRVLASPGSWADPEKLATLLAPGSTGAWHALCRLAWASGDLSASLGAVADLETGAFLANLEAEAAIQGRAILGLAVAMPAGSALLEGDELGLSGRGWAALAAVAVHF